MTATFPSSFPIVTSPFVVRDGISPETSNGSAGVAFVRSAAHRIGANSILLDTDASRDESGVRRSELAVLRRHSL